MALSFVQAASAQNLANPGVQKLRTVFHPLCSNKEAFFPITEAYPASSGTYTASDKPSGLACRNVEANRRWCGENQYEDNTTAAPGALALCTKNAGSSDIRQRIDIDRFATCPTGFGNAFVQSYRLTKKIAASQKCPGVFQSQQYIQFGSNIRTWWTLIYTSPGTTFTLELTVRCVRTTFPFDVELHVDSWKWQVVVTNESLDRVIDVLHSNSISTSEIPCIAAENIYIALKRSVKDLKDLINTYRAATEEPAKQNARNAAQNAVFNLESLIIAFCAFGDCFESSAANPGGVFFPVFPPTNDTQMSLSGMLTGILDTPENPCCCKLLVDIEKLAEAYDIVSL
jgi:hypothetical protein